MKVPSFSPQYQEIKKKRGPHDRPAGRQETSSLLKNRAPQSQPPVGIRQSPSLASGVEKNCKLSGLQGGCTPGNAELGIGRKHWTTRGLVARAGPGHTGQRDWWAHRLPPKPALAPQGAGHGCSGTSFHRVPDPLGISLGTVMEKRESGHW